MYVDYCNLPKESRVWMYQSNKILSVEDLELISVEAINFIEEWTRHGEDLKGSFMLKYDRFLVLAVDESFNSVSGCSIDASMRFIKSLEHKLNVDFTDKLNIAYKEDNVIKILKLSEFQDAIPSGVVDADTIVFNNMVATKSDFETKWEVPVKNSWHSRFLK